MTRDESVPSDIRRLSSDANVSYVVFRLDWISSTSFGASYRSDMVRRRVEILKSTAPDTPITPAVMLKGSVISRTAALRLWIGRGRRKGFVKEIGLCLTLKRHS